MILPFHQPNPSHERTQQYHLVNFPKEVSLPFEITTADHQPNTLHYHEEPIFYDVTGWLYECLYYFNGKH
jgi:hypothetical protein